jgi:hypothetical protein
VGGAAVVGVDVTASVESLVVVFGFRGFLGGFEGSIGCLIVYLLVIRVCIC